MKLTTSELLQRLGQGEPIAAICQATEMTPADFDGWWQSETKSRVPAQTGQSRAAVSAPVRIERDSQGIPHIFAQEDRDLFFGFGYAVAQDRLFQLDYLRRRGRGRLAEILGPEGLELDLTARTLNLAAIAETEWATLPDETRLLTQAFADGINQFLQDSQDKLPIEFDLLGYRPEPWSPIDSLVLEGEFRWYLTGRFHVLCIPEVAKRTLGEGPLYQAFLQAEADGEAILPAGSYVPATSGSQPAGQTVGDPQAAEGSNNWVVSGARSATGKPLLASDPHIAMTAVSCWYEVHLSGGSFEVAGMSYAGMPAVMFGRNPQAAWGITNNICSLRDLYQERTDPAHPGCFLYNGEWEPAQEREEVIAVRGQADVCKTIRSSRNGPIVDEILPPVARTTGPVALRWLGQQYCGWLTALLGMNRARNVAELREAMRPWHVPTFCLVLADTAGTIGYQCSGRIPLRNDWNRGYREGWNPRDQWTGLIPFEGMPHVVNPAQGFVVTANNRVAANDYPYPLSGTWSSGHRALRIRECLTEQPQHTRATFGQLHQDALSLRAVDCVAGLVAKLETCPDTRVQAAVEILRSWDCHMEPDRVGATLFNVFFARWGVRVAEERFDQETAAWLSTAISGLSNRLLTVDEAGWFQQTTAAEAAIQVFQETLDWLAGKLGPDLAGWGWGQLHVLQLKHVLSARGDLGRLLDRGGIPVKGDGLTVCNTGADPNFLALMGAGYRLIADLADPQGGLWAIDVGSQSGHPGSPHYDDQITQWAQGGYHYLPLTALAESRGVLVLTP